MSGRVEGKVAFITGAARERVAAMRSAWRPGGWPPAGPVGGGRAGQRGRLACAGGHHRGQVHGGGGVAEQAVRHQDQRQQDPPAGGTSAARRTAACARAAVHLGLEVLRVRRGGLHTGHDGIRARLCQFITLPAGRPVLGWSTANRVQ